MSDGNRRPWVLPAAIAWVVLIVIGREVFDPPLDLLRVLYTALLASLTAWVSIRITTWASRDAHRR